MYVRGECELSRKFNLRRSVPGGGLRAERGQRLREREAGLQPQLGPRGRVDRLQVGGGWAISIFLNIFNIN